MAVEVGMTFSIITAVSVLCDAEYRSSFPQPCLNLSLLFIESCLPSSPEGEHTYTLIYIR